MFSLGLRRPSLSERDDFSADVTSYQRDEALGEYFVLSTSGVTTWPVSDAAGRELSVT